MLLIAKRVNFEKKLHKSIYVIEVHSCKVSLALLENEGGVEFKVFEIKRSCERRPKAFLNP